MNKYIIVVWIEILVFTISCRDECKIQTKVSWKDSLFLEVKGDIRDLSSWSDTDINYYFAAEKRLGIHEDGGRFVWDSRRGG
ncbi:hypothetical protein [Gabonibacter chumensis]|uniref:hypothetical protein n=1 Tax=Gabonibacter chumensis TaxID=2972474 RepID=UPI0025730FB2|nr:hypothetical protein [Gabonibacter chumensis]MCR9012073.1 hypothetical protein [Gabonibacter chumensis]